MIHTSSKFHQDRKHNKSYGLSKSLSSQWMASDFHNSNLYNFCYTAPNPTCKLILQSSQYKEQSLKVFIPKKFSLNEIHLVEIWLQLLLRSSAHTHIFRISFLSFLPYLKWRWSTSTHAPYPKSH